MSPEKQMISAQKRIDALRELIQRTSYMKSSEVMAHLNMSRHTLDTLPREVLPWVPGTADRDHRRYHPADVAAYPARARRWRDARGTEREAEVLAEMRAELEARDRAAIEDALRGYAA